MQDIWRDCISGATREAQRIQYLRSVFLEI